VEVPNVDQADTDTDTFGDACDGCLTDPAKTDPGICGCGVPDIDSDGDGTFDCDDDCPNDMNKVTPGICGCGVTDTDSDGDGIHDCNDDCPNDPDKTEPGVCGCGTTDKDSDRDGTADCRDVCPGFDDNVDTDGDGVPEGCEVAGCTDPAATNYDPNATDEIGTCIYPPALLREAGVGVPAPLITAGMGHTCALTDAGGLQCWGFNDFGQVGDGTFTDRLTPVNVLVVDPTTVISLVSGTNHTCVLTTANEVFCWGFNSSGQLGNGSTWNSNVPVPVGGLEGTITSISAGAEFTCAQNAAGEVFCWGNNASGQLNDGTLDNSSIPVRSTSVSGAVHISGGSTELQGITSDGAVQRWNAEPVIGIPEENNVFVSADRFMEGGCTITTTGEVFCWGGIANAAVSGVVVRDMLASGEGHACTMKAGGLVCWGSNSSGQLGDGSLDDSDAETSVKGLGHDVMDLAAGAAHTCVVMEDETIACWGNNRYGQLGNSTTSDSSEPVMTG